MERAASTATALFARLSETTRFYSVLSAVVLVLGLASGLAVSTLHPTCTPDLNPRTPIFSRVSPWGRLAHRPSERFLRPDFEVIGVVTPMTEDTASYDCTAAPGQDLKSIAADHGIDLDLLASANGMSYARVPRADAEVRLPLLYSRDRSWDRSLEFLYSMSRKAPIGGNGKAKKGAPSIERHVVSRGECLWTIARKHHVSMETIIAQNDLASPRYLRPGQILEIVDTDGLFITVKKGDTVSGILDRYNVELTDLVNSNPGVDVDRLSIRQKLFLPGTKALGELWRFAWPAHGRISSRYGYRYHPIFHRRMMHTGLDIAARYGSPIRAALAGRVVFAGRKGGYGKTVVLDHANGYETLYGHCSKILVKRGQTVKKGQQIATVGNTGISTGPHLHFEVEQHGKRMNPEKALY